MNPRLSSRHPQGGEYRIIVRGPIGAASPAIARCERQQRRGCTVLSGAFPELGELIGALDDLRSRQVELISVLPAA
jgi:hypothetical protein